MNPVTGACDSTWMPLTKVLMLRPLDLYGESIQGVISGSNTRVPGPSYSVLNYIISCNHVHLLIKDTGSKLIVKILSHLGLPTRAPQRAPARRVDLFQTI